MDTDSWLNFAGHRRALMEKKSTIRLSSANICAVYPTPGFTLDKGSKSVD